MKNSDILWRSLVDTSQLAKALYARDNSLYRVVPYAVARPENVEQLAQIVDLAQNRQIPVTVRGAGTSCCGNAIGPGIVVDLRKLNKCHIDPDSATATVEPGVVLAHLNAAAAQFDLRFGPDPSTFTRCTIGGMIGNDACGPRALGFGRTSDNLLGVELLNPLPVADLAHIGREHQDLIRQEFGRFSRQVSGYALQHLLPEQFAWHKLLVGAEGTLGLVIQATLQLKPMPKATALVGLGYPSMAEAAEAVPDLLSFGLLACEGLDKRIVQVAKQRGPVPDLPKGDGYLIIEVGADSAAEAHALGLQVAKAGQALDAVVLQGDPAAALWKVRADGAGFAAVALEKPAHAGWEDSAVPPEKLGTYLRALEDLLAEHGLHALPYGHFGEGCIHARIDFLPAQPQRIRQFCFAAAQLAVSLGGSLSGEHGDGRARSELLQVMYSEPALAAFAAVKRCCDPDNLFNPGVLVNPAAIDENVSVPFGESHPLAKAHKCSGVGACLSRQPKGQMCPSFRVSGDEADSTRGRARVLQEALRQDLFSGVDSAEVKEVLEHCLACKSCRKECPTSVDMAELKSIAWDQIWAKKVRPLSHYTMGRLPQWLRLLARIPGAAQLVNWTAARCGYLICSILGVDSRRRLPKIATRKEIFAAYKAFGDGVWPASGGANPVLVWADCFSTHLDPEVLAALVVVLRAAGFSPKLLTEDVCCGLTWISTGQRDQARKKLTSAVEILYPIANAKVPILGLEPSCTAVWKSDAASLLPDDFRVQVVANQVCTLAQLLQESGFKVPDLSGHTIVVQPHCHHRAVLGWEADAQLLAASKAQVVTVDGCCGLAGNYGFEAGHYEMSAAIAQQNLLPALAAHPDAIYLADGYSCRTQVKDLTSDKNRVGRAGVTLAQLLAPHLD